MKILALDIGAGTQDILLYDEKKGNIENCVKMVLPSPSLVFAGKVRRATLLCRGVFVKGAVIGGGAFAHALKEHIKKGLRVCMTESTAYTIRNDLDEVREMGIEIVHEETDLGDRGVVMGSILKPIPLFPQNRDHASIPHIIKVK